MRRTPSRRFEAVLAGTACNAASWDCACDPAGSLAQADAIPATTRVASFIFLIFIFPRTGTGDASRPTRFVDSGAMLVEAPAVVKVDDDPQASRAR
jgi:hypothetical protein